MNEAARTLSRRAFLKRAAIVTAGVSAALIVGEEVFEQLGAMFPRRLVTGVDFAAGPDRALWHATVEAGEPLSLELMDRVLKQIYAEPLIGLGDAELLEVFRPDRFVAGARYIEQALAFETRQLGTRRKARA